MSINKNKTLLLKRGVSKLTGFKKITGLIGKEKAEIITFKTRFGIHTFFLKFPIDVVIVTKNKRVVFFKKMVKPKRFVFWNPRFDTVIELPGGTIKDLGIKIGSILKF